MSIAGQDGLWQSVSRDSDSRTMRLSPHSGPCVKLIMIHEGLMSSRGVPMQFWNVSILIKETIIAV
jgi:hypothetical protein